LIELVVTWLLGSPWIMPGRMRSKKNFDMLPDDPRD
jgi:hypothetical protein